MKMSTQSQNFSEEELKLKSNGLQIQFLIFLLLIASIGLIGLGAMSNENKGSVFCIILGSIGIIISTVLQMGMKILKPKEALVLTLFGNYAGTIKQPGFYFVNPFSVAVNPAARTQLGQSGDVKGRDVELGKKISLKVMTLNNSKQKIKTKKTTGIEPTRRHPRRYPQNESKGSKIIGSSLSSQRN